MHRWLAKEVTRFTACWRRSAPPCQSFERVKAGALNKLKRLPMLKFNNLLDSICNNGWAAIAHKKYTIKQKAASMMRRFLRLGWIQHRKKVSDPTYITTDSPKPKQKHQK